MRFRTLPLASPRLAVGATFTAFGLNAGVCAGASAAIIARVHASAFEYGVALTVTTVLYLACMTSAGAVANRFGARAALLASLAAAGPILALLLAARSMTWLGVALALYGIVAGMLDATMNGEGARVEQRLRKPIFVQFHALASAGTAVGATLGGYLAFRGLGVVAVAIVEAALLGAAWLVARAVDGSPGAPEAEAAPRDVGRARRAVDFGLATLGLAVGVSIVCEASAIAWSGLLITHAAPKLVEYAGLGASFFAGFQSVIRFGIDRLRHVFSDRALMLASYGMASVGLAAVGADYDLALTLLGFAIVGAGTGAIVPCGFALAARRPGLSAATSISAVAFFGLFPRAPAPLLTGWVADAFSLSSAFFGLAALMLIAGAAIAFLVAPAAVSRSLAPGGLAK